MIDWLNYAQFLFGKLVPFYCNVFAGLNSNLSLPALFPFLVLPSRPVVILVSLKFFHAINIYSLLSFCLKLLCASFLFLSCTLLSPNFSLPFYSSLWVSEIGYCRACTRTAFIHPCTPPVRLFLFLCNICTCMVRGSGISPASFLILIFSPKRDECVWVSSALPCPSLLWYCGIGHSHLYSLSFLHSCSSRILFLSFSA